MNHDDDELSEKGTKKREVMIIFVNGKSFFLLSHLKLIIVFKKIHRQFKTISQNTLQEKVELKKLINLTELYRHINKIAV